MRDAEHAKIGILVVAYNAASTLATVLDRIPEGFRSRITEVLVSDDHSQDSTYLVGLGYQQTSDLPITMIRQPQNLGYGGNQKAGYRLAIEHGLDVIVMLHGDGQYAPECLPEMVTPLLRGEADAVFGSRMIIKGAARRGGMPMYKFLGNRLLTNFENAVLGSDLTEFHSGYRAYSVDALRQIPFERNADGFNFDTQIIIQLHDAGKRIVEIPIPTFYGDEICYVNGIGYAIDVSRDVVAYRLQKVGFGDGSRVGADAFHQTAGFPDSAHGRMVARLASRPPSKILELGCSAGDISTRLRALGHYVTGVDKEESQHIHERVSSFVRADLNQGIPPEVGTGFDIVLAPDVLGQVNEPAELLSEMRSVLRSGGSAVICVPNVAHWYPRFRILLGLFGYDRRGILDRSHIRFFTRRTIRRMAEQAGYDVRQIEAVGIPLAALGVSKSRWKGLRVMDQILLAVWPTMFGYQFIVELMPNNTGRR